MRFTLEMEPDARDIEMAFSKWARLIDDFGPVFQDVVKLFRKHEARQFSTEGKATGGKWTALSPAYATWKKKNFPKIGMGCTELPQNKVLDKSC